jgi:hypothetical protein
MRRAVISCHFIRQTSVGASSWRIVVQEKLLPASMNSFALR